MIDFFENIDRDLLFLINGTHSDFLNHLMWNASAVWFGIPFYIFFSYLVYKSFGLKPLLFFLLFGGIAVGLCDLSAKHLFKEVFERYRPSHNLQIQHQLHYINDYHGGRYGFVSSHAANMFGVTVFSILILLKSEWKKKVWILLLFPFIVGYSRIYLGVHYPSDVICGGLLGSLIAWIIYRILHHTNLINLIHKQQE